MYIQSQFQESWRKVERQKQEMGHTMLILAQPNIQVVWLDKARLYREEQGSIPALARVRERELMSGVQVDCKADYGCDD